jgi:V/A-type H+/Na+-transporting ATPase subunit D
MAFTFQYNKAALFQIQKQLEIRTKALPVLKNKEMALRMEVKKAKSTLESLQHEFKNALDKEDDITLLCSEFDSSLITLDYVESSIVSVAGVKVPELGKVVFNVKTFNLFIQPYWFAAGIKFLEAIITMKFRIEFLNRKMMILENARKKTTQKVNLYEKNQIPAYNHAILKIKRFLEDEENLSKSAQKILKSKTENKELS